MTYDTPTLPAATVDLTAHRRMILREAAGVCRNFAQAVRSETGPSSPEPEFDAAVSCATLIETLASLAQSGEPRSLSMYGIEPSLTMPSLLQEGYEIKRDACASIPDINEDVDMTLSAIGLQHRRRREIAYASEIVRLRHLVREQALQDLADIDRDLLP